MLLAACSAATDSSTERGQSGAGSASPGVSPGANDAAAFMFEPRAAHTDARFGVPTFVWLTKKPGAAFAVTPGTTAKDMAWSTLRRLSEMQRLGGEALAAATLNHLHDTGDGAIIARFGQSVGGIEVFNVGMNIALTRDLAPVASTGFLTPVMKSWKAKTFKLEMSDAVASAFAKMTGKTLSPGAVTRVGEAPGGYSELAISADALKGMDLAAPTPARMKKVYFPNPKGLEPAYYVELDVGAFDVTESDMHAYVVSAADGAILFKKDLSAADAYKYRVWADKTSPFMPFDGPQGLVGTPHPTGTPNKVQYPFIAPNLVELANAPFSKNDPWLPPAAQDLTGNNIEAYADLIAPDGYNAHPVPPPPPPTDGGTDGGDASTGDAGDAGTTDAGTHDSGTTTDAGTADGGDGGADGGAPVLDGDLRAPITAPGTFDRVYDTTKAPESSLNQRYAAITSLFFTTNYMHDFFYDSGYDEAAGNPQRDNFGRGGIGGDPIHSEAQDFSGRNNANASTPADGKSPRIQMYLFDGRGISTLTVNSPSTIAGKKEVGVAAFGAKDYTLTGTVAISAPADGCNPLTNAAAITGKIAIVDRGTCAFAQKAFNAQKAGAVGVILADNRVEAPINPGPSGDPAIDDAITVPVMFTTQAHGTAIKTALATTPVNVTLYREKIVDLDGSLDAGVIAHEWGHTLSNRLIGNGSGLENIQGRGMGEGWSDFVALLLLVREEDAQIASNPNFTGTYAMGAYDSSGGDSDGYYYGFRRYPYSVDMTKNPLTYKYVTNGLKLPTDPPPAFGNDGSDNSEVHNIGEVWASMLWECYVSLLQDGRYTFAQARERMKSYLIASLKLTPSSPTILEARDAVLAAAYAKDPADHRLFYAAFAKRGAGAGAVAADRDTEDNTGVAEGFGVGGDVKMVSATLDDSVFTCDRDGVLDNNETGKLTIQIRNEGVNPLGSTTAFVSAWSPALSFGGNAILSFGPTRPNESTTASIDVSLKNAPAVLKGDIDIDFRDPGLFNGQVIHAKYARAYQFDVGPATSATDTVDAPLDVWVPGGDPAFPTPAVWARTPDGPDAYLHVANAGETADQYTVSPALNVAATGDFSFTFKHRYRFEVDLTKRPPVAFDGGVVEISADNGATWTDLGDKMAVGYDATLTEGDPGSESDNPLKGRDAYAGESSAWPAFSTETINLGTAYANKTVKVRFRVGSDQGTGRHGWDVDDIAFTNITNTPFATRINDKAVCVNRTPSADAGAAQTVPERSTVTLTGSGIDPDGNTLTYAWTQKGGPAVTLSSATAAAPTFTAPEVTATTQLTFALTVNDGTNTSAPATVTVDVTNVNRAPIADAGKAQTVAPAASVTLAGDASKDPDGDALTYAWTQISGPPVEKLADADKAAPTFTTPVVTSPATVWFSLIVSDGQLTSTPSTVAITINPPAAPVEPTPPKVYSPGANDSGCSVSAAGTSSSDVGSRFGFAAIAAAIVGVGRRFRRRNAGAKGTTPRA